MMPWNRKEAYVTNSLERLAEIRSALAKQGIKYDYKSPYGGLSGRGHASSIPVGDPNAVTTYRVFVHKKDYDKALAALRQK